MAFLSEDTSIAVAVQSAADSWGAPDSGDLWPCANLRMSPAGVTATNPEYLGTIHKPGPFVVGETVTLTLTLMLRTPGGANPPIADAFIPGRFLRACGFTETIVSTGVPAAAAAIGVGSTTTVAVLGSGAVATANLYKGMALSLSDAGASYPTRMTAISAYTAAREASLAETLDAPPAANYQVVKQLAYQLSAGSDNPLLSASVWLGGVRYDLINLAASACRINVPTANQNATEIPAVEMTFEGTIHDFADEVSPAITPLGAIPMFKDGDFWVANKALGGSGFSVDLGVRSAAPPNPNKPLGQDARQMVETNRTATINLVHNLKATADFLALARNQAYHPLWGQWGYTAGNMVSVIVPEGRFNIPSVDNSGEFVTQSIDMFIDGADKAINIVFPY